ncbi:ABC transporter substrate-binding protein [Pseudomonas matsuisoli]|uniref:Fe/B12 periplasmic-binding domain-containing protein n=1 Tax=Pseudomonas matsuisoli TaxID=1515666 RepID=A0A917PQQ9_9PSED|nr:ABC transporter substrate-binding protein [Pseudomonas matsuisoli]GGJ87509.1 hypothetical protein GCM10009304_11690 [Pseudomonas matsuisoli]
MTKYFLAGLLLASIVLPAQASDYPLTVRSCDREVTFDRAPRHVAVHDTSLASMLLKLGLRDRIAGYSGFDDSKPRERWVLDSLAGVPQLAKRYPSLETLLDADIDLFFAGWNYGMHVGGAVTPATLQPFGIPVYELTESCSHVQKQRRPASLDDLYRDLRALGAIFSVKPTADALVSDIKGRVQKVQATVKRANDRPRVFLYDSGEDRPFTSGRLGMPQALIDIAGGHNIMDDVAASWTQVNWESVVERDPQIIAIVDYGPLTWQQKRDFLLQQPALQDVQAIRDQRFVVLTYMEATPSVANALATEKLAKAFHPTLFEGALR